MVNSVLALSCLPPMLSCSCVENTCISKNLYESTDIADCEKFEDGQKDTCIDLVQHNIDRKGDRFNFIAPAFIFS